MEILTPYEIADLTGGLNKIQSIKAINKLFRDQDESHLFPINGKFNATNRAIRQASQYQREYGAVYGLEYALLLDNLISNIVNSPNI